MRSRLWLIPLLLASMACNLMTSNVRPTPGATVTLVSFIPTPALTTTTSAEATTMDSGGGISGSDVSGTNAGPCTPRSDWPTIVVQPGDALSTIAERTGSTVEALVSANCLSDANAVVAGQLLRVPTADGQGQPPTQPGPQQPEQPQGSACQVNWFFQLSQSVAESQCPDPEKTVNAAGENFEGGRVLWYASGTSGPGKFYVIYNDHTYQIFPDTWDESQPSSDPGIVPPANRFQPVRGIGKLWREQPGVRAKLGWAYELEVAFTGRIQGYQSYGEASPVLYIDHGKWNVVTRLNTATNTWIVAGSY
jgi:LysM repeat protein